MEIVSWIFPDFVIASKFVFLLYLYVRNTKMDIKNAVTT